MRNRLLLSLVLLVFLLPGCGGDSPVAAFQDFAKVTGREGVTILDSQATAMLTKDALAKLKSGGAGDYFFDTAETLLLRGFKVLKVDESNGIASITYKSNSDERTYTATLIKEGGFWRVQEYETLDEALDRINQ